MNRRRTGIFRKTSVHIIYLNRQFRDKITIDQYRSKDLLFAVIVDKRVSVQLLDIPSIHFLYHIQNRKRLLQAETDINFKGKVERGAGVRTNKGFAPSFP